MAALAQAVDRLRAHPVLDGDVPPARLARIERARERLCVMPRRVDRLLQVHPEMDVREERVERPLILLVAARCAEREIRLAVARDERRRERRPRPFARLERVRQACLEPEHLRARAETEAE